MHKLYKEKFAEEVARREADRKRREEVIAESIAQAEADQIKRAEEAAQAEADRKYREEKAKADDVKQMLARWCEKKQAKARAENMRKRLAEHVERTEADRNQKMRDLVKAAIVKTQAEMEKRNERTR